MSATAKAPAASGTGNSQPTLPPPAQNPWDQWATIATTTRSAATTPGPIGPPSPRTISRPPPASAAMATSAQNIPGRSPMLLNQPATPAGDPPFPTQPSLRKPCIATTPPITTRSTNIARSAFIESVLPAASSIEEQRADADTSQRLVRTEKLGSLSVVTIANAPPQLRAGPLTEDCAVEKAL